MATQSDERPLPGTVYVKNEPVLHACGTDGTFLGDPFWVRRGGLKLQGSLARFRV